MKMGFKKESTWDRVQYWSLNSPVKKVVLMLSRLASKVRKISVRWARRDVPEPAPLPPPWTQWGQTNQIMNFQRLLVLPE